MFYLWKDVWPLHLCAVYPKWPLGDEFLPLILVAAREPCSGWDGSRWGRGPFFAWAYFIVALLPVLGILNMTFLDQAYVADWWQQLALPAVHHARRRRCRDGVVPVAARAGRASLAVLLTLVVLFLGARTLERGIRL